MPKILFLFLFAPVVFASGKEERVLNELIEHQKLIQSSAASIGISPRLVASIIYTERYLNYNWEDDLLDGIFAETGYNSSIGFAQIKVNTALWIEKESHNSASLYYLGSNIEAMIKPSGSRSELIHRLLNDSTNIFYSCVYLGMIAQRWKKGGVFFDERNETGILATLYCIGVIQFDGTERKPHLNPQMNHFGQTAQSFYDGFALSGSFQ